MNLLKNLLFPLVFLSNALAQSPNSTTVQLSTIVTELRDRVTYLEKVSQGYRLPYQTPVVGRERWTVSYGECNMLRQLFPLPPTLTGMKQTLDDAYTLLLSKSDMHAYLAILQGLCMSGLDAHLLVGAPNPLQRPIWIEVYTADKVTAIHHQLRRETSTDLTGLASLPFVIRKAEYGLTYKDLQWTPYRIKE